MHNALFFLARYANCKTEAPKPSALLFSASNDIRDSVKLISWLVTGHCTMQLFVCEMAWLQRPAGKSCKDIHFVRKGLKNPFSKNLTYQYSNCNSVTTNLGRYVFELLTLNSKEFSGKLTYRQSEIMDNCIPIFLQLMVPRTWMKIKTQFLHLTFSLYGLIFLLVLDLARTTICAMKALCVN